MGKVIHLDNESFEKEVLNSGKLVVVDFWAAWCGPCRMVGPILDELAGEMENVVFAKVDVDEQGELADKYQIRSIPTMIFFKNGKPVETAIGASPKATLKAKVEKYL